MGIVTTITCDKCEADIEAGGHIFVRTTVKSVNDVPLYTGNAVWCRKCITEMGMYRADDSVQAKVPSPTFPEITEEVVKSVRNN